jgi:hypothetical protein
MGANWGEYVAETSRPMSSTAIHAVKSTSPGCYMWQQQMTRGKPWAVTRHQVGPTSIKKT